MKKTSPPEMEWKRVKMAALPRQTPVVVAPVLLLPAPPPASSPFGAFRRWCRHFRRCHLRKAFTRKSCKISRLKFTSYAGPRTSPRRWEMRGRAFFALRLFLWRHVFLYPYGSIPASSLPQYPYVPPLITFYHQKT